MEHNTLFYLWPWGIAVVTSIVALALVSRTPWSQQLVWRTEPDREYSAPVFRRFGGAIVVFIFLMLLVVDTNIEWNAPFLALCIGSLAILLFSLADDLRHVSWPWHLVFQILLGILVFASNMQLDFGTYFSGVEYAHFVSAGIIGLVGVIGWVVLIMNAINWADGTDGLMPGIALCSFGTLFLLALRPEVNQPAVALITITLLGLSLGLLVFNWYPAQILAGTGGAYFFGFTLAVLALYAGMKVATLLLVLVVPVFDALFVIIRRIIAGYSPFRADSQHLHHLLLARGFRPAQVATVYLVVTSLMGLLALSLERENKALIFLMVGISLLMFLGMLHISLRVRGEKTDTV